MTMKVIEIPSSRIPRLMKMLGMSPTDEVTEVLLFPTGGLITKVKKDRAGRRIPIDGDPQNHWMTESFEVVFTPEIDPMYSSSVGRES